MEGDDVDSSSSDSGPDTEEMLEDEQEDLMEDDGEEEEGPVKKNGGKSKNDSINSRCSVKRLYKMMDDFGEEKNDLVKEMGFPGVLDLPYIGKSNRRFSLWLFRHIDEEASSFSNGFKRDVPFDGSDFSKVLGVPSGGTPISTNPGKDVIDEVWKILGLVNTNKKIQPIEDIVKKKFKKPMNKKQKDAFKVAFAICVVNYLLSPHLKHNYHTTDYWGALHTPELIPMYDWGKLVQDGILATARRVKSETNSVLNGRLKKISNLTGCTHGMQVLYLDNLDLLEKSLPHDVFPRCKVYTESLMNKMISSDMISSSKSEVSVFGRRLPRHRSSVCYSRNTLRASRSCDVISSTSNCGNANDPLLSEIAAILIDKATRSAAVCKEALLRASKRGEEQNKRHSEAWEAIVSDTNALISAENASVVATIERVTEVVKRRRPSCTSSPVADKMRLVKTLEGRLDGQIERVRAPLRNATNEKTLP